MTNSKKRVLICPLDWGLGHAARVIPVVRELIKNGYDVILGADNHPLAILREEFPELEYIVFPGYRVQYSNRSKQILKLAFQLPGFLESIKKEYALTQELCRTHRIDIIISDNRYGIYSPEVYSILITHQLMVKSPLGRISEDLINKQLLSYIRNFNECWIPDLPGTENFSGDLSHKYPLPENARFVGILSRFNAETSLLPEKEFDIAAIISGPEKQRTTFENVLISQLGKTNSKCLIVRGLPDGQKYPETTDNITMKNNLSTPEIERVLRSSDMIICRSGYSSVMDLATTGRHAVLVPTPGQTEQEYLSEYLQQKNWFISTSQSKFSIEEMHKKYLRKTFNSFPDQQKILKEVVLSLKKNA